VAAVDNKKAALGRLFYRHTDGSVCSSAARDYFFSSAAGASAFGASAAGASAFGASAAGASAFGGSAAGAGAAASSFLPQAASASASREAISNDFFMVILQVRMKSDSKSEFNNYR
jgi:hypothetical protein